MLFRQVLVRSYTRVKEIDTVERREGEPVPLPPQIAMSRQRE